jgi:hypothetical protein
VTYSEHLLVTERQILAQNHELFVALGKSIRICGCKRDWMYSGRSNVDESSFIVAPSGTRMRLDLDARDDRLDISPGVKQRQRRQLFSLMRLPSSSRDAAARASRHQGDATYFSRPSPSITGVTIKSSGRVSTVA